MVSIIAYTFEADIHCPACSINRFPTLATTGEAMDKEGNPVRPVFSTDEIEVSHCSDCGAAIE